MTLESVRGDDSKRVMGLLCVNGKLYTWERWRFFCPVMSLDKEFGGIINPATGRMVAVFVANTRQQRL